MQCIKGLPVSAGENGPRLGTGYGVPIWSRGLVGRGRPGPALVLS